MSFSISKIPDNLLVLTQLYRNYNTLYKRRSYFRIQTKKPEMSARPGFLIHFLEANVIFKTAMVENTYINDMVIFII